MRKGFILVEFLIAMISVSFLLITISSISAALLHLPKITYVTQLDLFKLQLTQLFSLSNNIKIEENSLCFALDTRHFCIEAIDTRLVKKPGYEILLDNVSKIRWEIKTNEVILYGVYIEEPFVLNFTLE